jgi:hypothetical protein
VIHLTVNKRDTFSLINVIHLTVNKCPSSTKLWSSKFSIQEILNCKFLYFFPCLFSDKPPRMLSSWTVNQTDKLPILMSCLHPVLDWYDILKMEIDLTPISCLYIVPSVRNRFCFMSLLLDLIVDKNLASYCGSHWPKYDNIFSRNVRTNVILRDVTLQKIPFWI